MPIRLYIYIYKYVWFHLGNFSNKSDAWKYDAHFMFKIFGTLQVFFFPFLIIRGSSQVMAMGSEEVAKDEEKEK